jgi:cell division protease FtsH
MTMLLGGRVAELIVFGSITTGASDDLDKVAEISRAMVHEYAMGTGLTSSRMSTDGDHVAEATRRVRDAEQRDLADEAYRAAHHLISTHREQLEALAATLLQHEVLERKEIARIMEGVPTISHRPTPDLRMAAATERQLEPPAEN